jgi:ligand-binding sensor domain-containing protein
MLSSLQDKFGYLWFGTQQGLVRYDGYQAKLYTFSDDNGEFVKYASVQDLSEDNQGLIWAVLMHHGIYYLDRKKNLFVKATIKNKTESDFDPAAFSKSFPDNKQGYYWIKSVENNAGSKIYLFDNVQHKMESFGTSAGNGYFLPCYRYCDLLKDHSGNIWATADSMLYIYNPETHSFNPYFVLPGKLRASIIGKIVQDPVNADLLWMTTADKVLPYGIPDAFNDVVQFKNKNYFVSFGRAPKRFFRQETIFPLP